MRRALLLAAAVTCAAAPACAQATAPPACAADETVQRCQARFTPTGSAVSTDTVPSTSVAAAGSRVAAERLNAKAAGPDLSSAGPLSSIDDFLPKLATALLFPTSGGGTPDIGFKTNLALNDGVLMRFGFTGQVSAVLHDPEPYAPLVDSIPSSIRDAAVTQLTSQIAIYDNVTVTGAINFENLSMGRSLVPHRDAVRRLAVALLVANPRAHPRTLAFARFNQLMSALANRPNDGTVLTGAAGCPQAIPADLEIAMSCFQPAVRDSIQAAIGRMADANAAFLTEAVARVRSSGFVHLAQLLNNQPQLNFAFELNPRAALAGPSQWTGRMRFEMGFANWNGLRHFCGGSEASIAAACLQKYITNSAVTGSLRRADRVFAQLDVTRRGAWHVNLPADSVNLSVGAGTSLVASAGYGAYVSNAADEENRDRIDVQSKYEFTRDDPTRLDRWVSTAFYTRRMNGQTAAVIGLTYANKPEFVGDVTRHLSANLGLTYKLNRNPSSQAGTP